jgi:hypothetical protein
MIPSIIIFFICIQNEIIFKAILKNIQYENDSISMYRIVNPLFRY